jgi:hypothetical protein
LNEKSLKGLNSPEGHHSRDVAAFLLCKELVQTHQVSDKTYKQALELFGENGVADIVVTTGFFTIVVYRERFRHRSAG